MTRIALVRYDQNKEGDRVSNHVTLEGLEQGIVERIRTTYGEEPKSVTFKHRAGIWLDTGGMVLTDQPRLRCRLKGYGVYYKLEHAPYLALAMEERIADTRRRRVYGGVECVTFYMKYWIAVIPLEDARRVLRHLKRNASRGFAVGDQRKAELAQSEHVHIRGKTPAEA